MTLRRSCALALLLAVFTPALGPLVSLASQTEHGCADHVCECTQRCPPKRSAGSACHGRNASRADCSMRGACRHDQAQATSVATTVYVAPETVTVDLILVAEPLGRTAEAPAPVDFSRIDPRPPRTV